MVFEKKQAQKLLIETMRKKGGQIRVKKSEQNDQWLVLSQMFQEGLVQLKEESETHAIYNLNPHQMSFKPGQKVLWQKGEELIEARVIRTSPRRIQIHVKQLNGTEQLEWVLPAKLTLR